MSRMARACASSISQQVHQVLLRGGGGTRWPRISAMTSSIRSIALSRARTMCAPLLRVAEQVPGAPDDDLDLVLDPVTGSAGPAAACGARRRPGPACWRRTCPAAGCACTGCSARPWPPRPASGREQRPHRPAPGHRPEAGRGGQGRAEQPVQHTQLQDTFGANMLALVDGVPRTLRLDQLIRYWGRAPDRGHRPAHPVPAPPRAGAGAHRPGPAQGDRPDRRGHRADPRQRVRLRRAAGPDEPAGDRRGTGPGHPRHAAAPAGRPGAPGAG